MTLTDIFVIETFLPFEVYKLHILNILSNIINYLFIRTESIPFQVLIHFKYENLN